MDDAPTKWKRGAVCLAHLAIRLRSSKPTCVASAATVREMKAQGLGAKAIAKLLGIGRASVYRVCRIDRIHLNCIVCASGIRKTVSGGTPAAIGDPAEFWPPFWH